MVGKDLGPMTENEFREAVVAILSEIVNAITYNESSEAAINRLNRLKNDLERQ